MGKLADGIGTVFALTFVGGIVALIVWAMFQPSYTYIGQYCNPQNICRYDTFTTGGGYDWCPPDDSGIIIIGQIGTLKPNTCKEEQ